MSSAFVYQMRSSLVTGIHVVNGTLLCGQSRCARSPNLIRLREFVQACRIQGLGFEALKSTAITPVLREVWQSSTQSRKGKPRFVLHAVGRQAGTQLLVTIEQATLRQGA